MKTPASTPCVGVCSTTYGDQICRGCKRTFREVIDWNRYDSTQKQQIYQRLTTMMVAVVKQFLIVIDPKQLQKTADAFYLRPMPYENAYCTAYFLLRYKSDQITDLAHCGLQLQATYQGWSLNKIFNEIDQHLYQRAQGVKSHHESGGP